MAVLYPTVADVRAAHRQELEYSGGAQGLRDANGLESAVMRPRQTFGGEELSDMFSKAAALFHSLVKNHPFVDGNKRTATIVTIAFLEVNGVSFQASNQELEEFVISAANGDRDFDSIIAWLTEKCSEPD